MHRGIDWSRFFVPALDGMAVGRHGIDRFGVTEVDLISGGVCLPCFGVASGRDKQVELGS
ncbi:MAG TPA: hypothetical protein VND64_04245 [Pirellulales bacterium]|nr:hypothetical protein [Pirellulales bacterium]